MRKFFFMALISTFSCLNAQDYWCLNKQISFRGDYVYWRRQEIRNLRLVEKTSDFQINDGMVKFKRVMTTENLTDRLNWESGVRGVITYHSDPCASIEMLYTYIFPWEAKKIVTGNGDLRFPFKDLDVGEDYNNADRVVGRYKSWLQNGEFNYWGHITPQRVNYFSFSWNLGFRSIYLTERMKLAFTRETSTSFYSIKTGNVLYGAQLGAMLEINPSCCWTWTFIVKGAGFLNTAKNELCITDENNTRELFEYTKRRWTDSYLIEGYGQLAYHWKSWLDIYFAYQGFLLTGLVLAPEQRDISLNRRRIHDTGQVVIDGLYAGLSLSF